MKDRYLFRGKSISSERWAIGHLVNCGENGYQIKEDTYHVNDGCCDLIPTVVDLKTIGQCTGLKDKNGALSFEGDKWKDETGRKGVIEWLGNGFEFGRFQCVLDSEGGAFEDGEFEITGSIHDEN